MTSGKTPNETDERKDSLKTTRCYIQLTGTNYAAFGLYSLSKGNKDANIIDEVNLYIESSDGIAGGEVCMRWYQSEEAGIDVRLHCWLGDWHALAQFKDVIEALRVYDDREITPQEFCQLLERCGFTNRSRNSIVPLKKPTI